MIARIRIVMDVTFPFTVDPPDANGVSPSQSAAGQYAHDTVLPQTIQAVAAIQNVATGEPETVIDNLCLVEEVRPA